MWESDLLVNQRIPIWGQTVTAVSMWSCDLTTQSTFPVSTMYYGLDVCFTWESLVHLLLFPCRALQNGALLRRSSKWRLLYPVSHSIQVADDTHDPQLTSRHVPSTDKLRSPHSPTHFLPPSPPGVNGREAAASLPTLAVARSRPARHPAVVLLAATQRSTACLNDIH